jgi:hypothetical protein
LKREIRLQSILSKKGSSKLKAILIIDLIIVSIAAAAFYYVQATSPLSPIQAQLSGLSIDPTEPEANQPFTVMVNVANTENTAGYYILRLLLDGNSVQNRTVDFYGTQSKIVNFTLTMTLSDVGNHTIQIGELVIDFVLSPPLQSAELQLTGFSMNQTITGIGQPVGISVTAKNTGEKTGTFPITVTVNDEPQETKTVTLGGAQQATVEFIITEATEGNYNVRIGSLSGILGVFAKPPVTELDLSNLNIIPSPAQPGKSVSISVQATNRGQASDSFTLDLMVNDAKADSHTVQLAPGVPTTVQFSVTGQNEGTYSVKVGNLMGTLTVQTQTGKPANLIFSNMLITPPEAWPGESVKMTVDVRNYGEQTGTSSLSVSINGEVKDNKMIQVNGGATTTVGFTTTAGPVGIYTAKINILTGILTVVKSGYHTLTITKNGASADFNIDGKPYTTPATALLPVGKHTIEMPPADPTGKYVFQYWEDTQGRNPTRTIDLEKVTTLKASYTGGSSCPSLYIWNGTSYIYATDISDHGWLGYINYINKDGSIAFYRNDPWDYVKLNSTELKPNNGYYNLTLIQRYDEVFYLDSAYMLAVDHPANTDVYSTMVEQYLDPNYRGQIYTVSNNLKTPISAVNEKGENVLPQISKMDGISTPGINGLQSPAYNNITWNILTLDLGKLSQAQQIKLVIRGVVDFGSPDDYSIWLDKFFAQPVPDGTQVTPPPYMEVKDTNGNWIRVPDGRQFPIPADTLRTYVVDLTGLFPTNDYSLRISNFWNVTFDYIAIDTSPQQTIIVTKVNPTVNLYKEFSSNSSVQGNFTKYGDVSPLVLEADDMFVIGKQGDAASLSFSTSTLPALAPNMQRDFFLFEACWFKDPSGNWGFGFGFTVEPLPFSSMSGFPYPSNESYPIDPVHLAYLQSWNTRVLNTP